MEEIYTVKEAAKFLKISERMLRRLLAERKMVHSRIGKRILITKDNIFGYLELTQVLD